MTFFVRVTIYTSKKRLRPDKRTRQRLKAKIAKNFTNELKVGIVEMKAISDDSLQLFTDVLTEVIEDISLCKLISGDVEKRLGGRCNIIDPKVYKHRATKDSFAVVWEAR